MIRFPTDKLLEGQVSPSHKFGDELHQVNLLHRLGAAPKASVAHPGGWSGSGLPAGQTGLVCEETD